ncbi:MAG: hypothetical protein WCK51_05340 [Armatimonadota bacterium]
MNPMLMPPRVPSTEVPTYHISHLRKFGFGVPEPNRAVLHAVDIVQSTEPEGGGYFIGVKADPPESPIGYRVTFFDRPLLDPPRCSSYCSGASYAAFMTALDLLLESSRLTLSEDVLEAVRMQEPNGGRREDTVKLYGWWNADGPGSFYALCGFSQMGVRVSPKDALPGDFCNINWVKGPGHSVVFLGWEKTAEGEPGMRFWSSQASTNGLGDKTVAVSSISGFVFTRLTAPAKLAFLNPNLKMERPKVSYDVPERPGRSGDPRTKTPPIR